MKKIRKELDKLLEEIPYISNSIVSSIENEENNISFSSNSEQESLNKKTDIEYLLDPRFWKTTKDSWYDSEFSQEKKSFDNNKIIEEIKDSLSIPNNKRILLKIIPANSFKKLFGATS